MAGIDVGGIDVGGIDVAGSLRLIGLTGGIGSGKSTVARMLAERGIPIVDADRLAREVSEPGGPAWADIAAAWPAALDPDGRVNRRKLGATIFADRDARTKLEAMMHPRIVTLAKQRVADLARDGHRLAFYEASLLVETGRYKELDGLVVVDAPEEARVARVVARDGATVNEVRARIAAQLPVEAKRRVATHIIENDGDLAVLRKRVDALVDALAMTAPARGGTAAE